MRIAITGATGFVGGYVTRELATRAGVTVMATARSAAMAERLPDGVEAVPLDLAAPGDDVVTRLAQADVLLHLGWGGLPNYLSRHHFETELPRHYAFLARLVEAGLPAMLVTGTCYEYGMVDGELGEDRTARPDNPYAFAKDALQRQLAFLQRDRPFALTWARLFYMYGEGQAPTSLYAQLQAALRRGDARFPMSGGQQLRDFLPVTEVARLIVDLALLRADAGIVNVCSGQPIAIRALVEQWMGAAGRQVELDLGHYPYPGYEPFAFWGSAAKCEELLAGTTR